MLPIVLEGGRMFVIGRHRTRAGLGTHSLSQARLGHCVRVHVAHIRAGLRDIWRTPVSVRRTVVSSCVRDRSSWCNTLTSFVISRLVKSIHTRIGQSICVHEAGCTR